MTLGWVPIVVDGKPAEVRICYVRAWNDPDWRKSRARGRKTTRKPAGPAPESSAGSAGQVAPGTRSASTT